MRVIPSIAAAAFTLGVAGIAVASGGEEHSGFCTVIFQGINLAILLGVIIHYARAPMRRSLEERAAAVTQEINEAGKLHAESTARLKEYEAKLAGLSQAADALLAEMRHEGEAEKARLIAEAEADAERIRKEAERLAENEIARARARLEAEVADLAVAAAERIIREKLSAPDHRRLAGEYLTRLEERA